MAHGLTKNEVAATVDRIQDSILGLGVRRLALFGSIARDEGRDGSDVDLLVEFASGKKSYSRLLDLADLLEEALAVPVELVTIEVLSPHIGPHILAEAADVLRAA